MSRIFARFDPLNELVRGHPPLVSRTVVIGGVAMLDWELLQTARFGADVWGSTGRTTEDIDVVIAAADDRGWLQVLTDSGWLRDARKRYRWRPPGAAGESCAVDLLGQFGGSGQCGGTEMRLQDYWGGEDGAYICRVLRAFQGHKKFPTMLTESFWDPGMQGFQWRRLNHMGLLLSKISAVGTVLAGGDAEHVRGLRSTPRLAKDLQDLLRLLRNEVIGHVIGWQGEVILEELVPVLVDEVVEHLRRIRAEARSDRPGINVGDCLDLLAEVEERLPQWDRQRAG
jgi:hypothetical protein